MMPVLLETLRISMIFNFTGVMIAEMYASRTGIGHLIANWGENFQLPELFAGVIMLARSWPSHSTKPCAIWRLDAVRGERDGSPDDRRRDRGRSRQPVYAGAKAACRRSATSR